MPAKKKTTTTKKKAAPARRSRASTSYTRRIRRRPVFSFGATDSIYNDKIFTDNSIEMPQKAARINASFNLGNEDTMNQYKTLITDLKVNNENAYKAFAKQILNLRGNANGNLLKFIEELNKKTPDQIIAERQAAAAQAKAKSDANTMDKLQGEAAASKAESAAAAAATAAAAAAAAKDKAAQAAAAQAAKSAGSAEASAAISTPGGNGGKGLALIDSVDNLTEGVNQTVTLLSKLESVESKLREQISELKKQLVAQGKKYTSLEQQHAGVSQQLAQAEQAQEDHATALAEAKVQGNTAAAAAAAAATAAATEHEKVLAEQKQQLEAAAKQAQVEGKKTTDQLNQRLSGLADLERQVNTATTKLKGLEEQLETALKNVPPVFKGDIEVGDYVANIMTEAATQVETQFGISRRFKFGSCGRKMHVKKRRK